MGLTELLLAKSAASDLEPLRGMPLKKLFLHAIPARDVSALADCLALEVLELPPQAINVERLRSLPNLRYLSFRWNQEAGRPAQTPAEFWAEFDAKAVVPAK